MYNLQNMFKTVRRGSGRDVYFVLHGEAKTHFNQDDRSSLTDDGFEQAEVLERRFSKINPDLIVTSPTQCALDTAKIVNRFLKVPLEENNLLVQRRMPKELTFAKNSTDKSENILRQMSNLHRAGKRFSDEETFDELKQRAFDVLNKIILARSAQHILIISHPFISRAILGVMLLGNKFSLDVFLEMDRIMLPINTGVTWCKDNGDGWKLLTWNDHAHLG